MQDVVILSRDEYQDIRNSVSCALRMLCEYTASEIKPIYTLEKAIEYLEVAKHTMPRIGED